MHGDENYTNLFLCVLAIDMPKEKKKNYVTNCFLKPRRKSPKTLVIVPLNDFFAIVRSGAQHIREWGRRRGSGTNIFSF